MQYTGSRTEGESDSDAYIELGNVSPMDLISFAYQIASGMVNRPILFPHLNTLVQSITTLKLFRSIYRVLE